MKFAVRREAITPAQPVFMHGFGSRDHKSEGVMEPLYMTAALLQANREFLIVTIDALGADRSFVVGIKDELKQAFGLEHAEVLINFSHTHHSVFLTGLDLRLRRGGYSMSQAGWPFDESELDYTEDEAYYRHIRDLLLSMVKDCYDHLTEGGLQVARGTSDFGCSRRRPDGAGGVLWMPYYEGEIDTDLFVLKLTDTAGQLHGILYCYGCHTTAIGADNYLLGNDFAGPASAMLERTYPGATAIFLQGCAGELKPRPGADGDAFISCSSENIREVGEMLARDIVTVMEGGSFKKVQCQFKAELCDPLLYTEKLPASFYQAIARDPESDSFHKAAATRTLKGIEDGTVKDRIPLYIAVWQFDEETSLVAIEGEVSTEYALKLKQLFGHAHGKGGGTASGGDLIVLGYTNGVFGYVPTRKMLQEGGYEAECNYYWSLSGPFVPEIEDIIIGQIAQAFGRLSGRIPVPAT
ncbi:neutral/alkaline non-lysosomal ceramidase N-terminal domain-containing protein [Paenibacillus sp. GCM10027626]|uniref:neutral/alkaline non-lysosomal ceramidase N-terminal domain-containing protein n=1 Tax=Paenibacillus sp. GCM10027626 TaxID=3273411 RepID=UPI003629C667